MDRNTYRFFERLEIVELGRRRRWSDEEKLKIVMESMTGPRLVSATARRYGISRSQSATWRRIFQDEPGEVKAAPTFVPAVLSSASEPRIERSAVAPSRIQIILSGGRRMIVDADVDPDALSRILDVVDRQSLSWGSSKTRARE